MILPGTPIDGMERSMYKEKTTQHIYSTGRATSCTETQVAPSYPNDNS
jgi:hypothetical protein